MPQCAEVYLRKKYSPGELEYHVRQCDLSGLFYNCNRGFGVTTIADLSPAGHEFLANVRKDGNWNKVKSIGKKIGLQSLSALMQISTQVAAELIQSQFLPLP